MVAQTNISLRGLRTFCVAAEHKSFTTAAELLFITPSAVSHQIRSLEEELGERLFERGSRELALTEIGQSFYDEVSPLIEQLDAVAASYKQVQVRKSVRISVQPFFASEYFVPRLSEFTADHPDIDIQVGTSDESTEKHPADADLSIRLFKKPPKDMPANRLFPLRMVPAGSKDFKKALKVRGRRIVSDFPLLVHESRPKAWAQWSAASGIELPKESKVTRLESMIAIVRAAEQGIGAALVPIPLADQWFRQRTIVRLFEQELVADVSYYLVCNKDRENYPAVRELEAWILENFAEDG